MYVTQFTGTANPNGLIESRDVFITKIMKVRMCIFILSSYCLFLLLIGKRIEGRNYDVSGTL